MDENLRETLEKSLDALPRETGVYLFTDAGGDVLYVGKAKDLRRRVRSYFTPSAGEGRVYAQEIRQETRDVRFIVTDNEKEALLLESNLIKKHRPPYNLDLRDDKNYLCLRLTVKDEFPRLHAVRKIRKDGARYFGPFASASALRETLRFVASRFPLRRCGHATFRNRTRPCLRHEIGQCTAPCSGRINRDDYARVVREATLFLEGKIPELAEEIRDRMKKEAEDLRFEEAAALRDLAGAVEKTLVKQNVVSHDLEDRDVFGTYREGGDLGLAVLFVRDGKVVDSKRWTHPVAAEDEDVLPAALVQFYENRTPPPTVLLPKPLEDEAPLADILTERRGAAVRIASPRRGPKRALVALAGKNASHALARSDRALKRNAEAMEDLRRRLRLPTLPRRIECFDASHIAGAFAVGSMAVFRDGRADTGEYRTYQIRDATPGDDVAMMGELIARRYAPGKPDPPDLLLLDGGPGQLRAAVEALERAGRRPFPVAGLAKERGADAKGRPDRIWLPDAREPLFLPDGSPALRLLMAVRDEAHRFAVRYHRKLRCARTLRSGLEELPGVGPKRRKALLQRFGSLKAIREASPDAIAETPGISIRLARTVHDILNGGGEDKKKKAGK